ncbi:hypothetical protein FSP39_014618 [Pinctada imbricata]|uniref:Uncharacterized protein n=1 Tax=Pinctada imbricata TaxID=66713 RepID=A0AA88XZ14_PINIB|nr:hypothetical protein FSP39_014618 [Pinctada imbricata]
MKKQKEVEPLLVSGKFDFNPKGKVRHGGMIIPEEKIEIDDDFEDEILVTEKRRKRRVSLIWQDFLLLTLEFLQFLAVLLSMSLRWTWPQIFLSNSYFIFLFNLDVYEFVKMHKDGVYISVQNYYTPSSTVPVNYGHIAIAWFAATASILLIYCLIYAVLYWRQHRKFLTIFAWQRRIYFVILQALTIPVGTFIAHGLQCNDSQQVDVINEFTCQQGLHWLLITFGILLAVVFFIVFPVFIIYKTRQEALGSCSKHHESFLLLKETEYKVGLNKSWLMSDMYLFSSFKYWGLYHRAVVQWLKMIIIIILFAAFSDTKAQSISVTVFFYLYAVGFTFLRPYRLGLFNFFMVFSYLCLGSLALIGAMATSFNVYTLSTPWLLPQYCKWILAAILVAWLACWICILLYLGVRAILYQTGKIKTPMWPTFSTSENDQLSCETKKFLKTFLRARFVLEKTQRYPAMFAPVHDLARQIQILNAYCREAEFLGDALHGTMWDLLDEMIEIHSKLTIRSLFAGVFLNGRAEKVRKTQLLTKPNLEKIWNEAPFDKEEEEEDGYFEDLYPDPKEIESDSSIDLSMDSSEIEEEETFTSMMERLHEEEEIQANLLRPETASSGQKSRPNSARSRTSTTQGQENKGFVFGEDPDTFHSKLEFRPGSSASKTAKPSSPGTGESRPGSGHKEGVSSRPGSGHKEDVSSRPGSGQGSSPLPGQVDDLDDNHADDEGGEGSQSEVISAAEKVVAMEIAGQMKGEKTKKKRKHSTKKSKANRNESEA